MLNMDAVKEQIRNAFTAVEYPGDWCLRGSNEGDEPYLLEQEFRGKADWQCLDPGFLDQAPAGYASALSFFSDEAFRFYLPAYMIADIDGRLERTAPVFHICHGLDDSSRYQPVNARRFGERTWFDEARHKFAMFTRTQAAAIVAYLRLCLQLDRLSDDTGRNVEQALSNYWLDRTGDIEA